MSAQANKHKNNNINYNIKKGEKFDLNQFLAPLENYISKLLLNPNENYKK